jgi:hypothetical protein
MTVFTQTSSILLESQAPLWRSTQQGRTLMGNCDTFWGLQVIGSGSKVLLLVSLCLWQYYHYEGFEHSIHWT